MPQFFTDNTISIGKTIELTGQDAHHIHSVLRLKKGDWIRISDGKGSSFQSEIIGSGRKCVDILIKEKLKRIENSPPPTLAISPISKERFEWVIEKSVELGCKEILPIITERTVPHRAKLVLDKKKIDRWNEIALSAAKQSGLPFKPQILNAMDFQNLSQIIKNYDSAILFYEGEKTSDIRTYWKNAKIGCSLIIIGPEGGFTSNEINLAKESGVTLLSLGQQILRVETAAIASIAIWQYEMKNMSLNLSDV